ncbi:aminoglycoside phosphotransferase family protein [Sphaerisporangium sp. NPDC049002]|uniref:phosphotransferase family protein n=1 Tax=Sphaerisporangium sp. NPDC049002 TaxID=3155392 RepID=UPI0033FF1871
MIDEIRALLTRHLPGREVRSITKLGEGLDNVAYEVDRELIVRGSKETDPAVRAETTRREAELLEAVARLSPLPVPEPVFADLDAGFLAYVKLPGVPLIGHPVAEPARLAGPLGGFLSSLHRAPVQEMEKLAPRESYPLVSWRDDAERDYRKVVRHVPAVARRLVEDFLARTPPAEPQVAAFCHNDLGGEHLLVNVRASAITGVIDWTDAAVTDPACDLALIFRDLGPEVFEPTLSHYDGTFDDADRERAAFYARCSLLEDLAYGMADGATRYRDSALAHLTGTFTH